MSTYRMEVQLDVLNDKECTKRWKADPATQICAGRKGDMKDVCNVGIFLLNTFLLRINYHQ